MRSEALRRLGELSQRLNAGTDGMTQRIKDLEKTLYKMRVGVSVWLDDISSDDIESCGHQIGYVKLKDKWRIVAREVRIGTDGGAQNLGPGNETMVLSKAPRLVRMRGVQKLDALVTALTDKVERFLAGLPPAEEGSEVPDAEVAAEVAERELDRCG